MTGALDIQNMRPKKGGKEVFYFNLFRSVLNAPGADQSRIYRNLAIGPAVVTCASLMLMLTQPQPSEQRYTMDATVASIHHKKHESGNLVTIEFHATHGPKARIPLEFTTARFDPNWPQPDDQVRLRCRETPCVIEQVLEAHPGQGQQRKSIIIRNNRSGWRAGPGTIAAMCATATLVLLVISHIKKRPTPPTSE